MLVIFGAAFVVMIMISLHAFDDFLLADHIAQHIQQLDHLHVRVHGLLQDILDPVIRLAADIDEQVAGGDGQDVRGGGLVAVEIDTIVQKEGQIHVLRFLAQDVPDPVVFREDGRDDVERVAGVRGIACSIVRCSGFRCACGWCVSDFGCAARRIRAAGGQAADREHGSCQKGSAFEKNLFHKRDTSRIRNVRDSDRASGGVQ